MADSQTQVDDDAVTADSLDQEQDSLAFLRGMPEPDFPVFDVPLAQDSKTLSETVSLASLNLEFKKVGKPLYRK
jgi:hypothetical protein